MPRVRRIAFRALGAAVALPTAGAAYVYLRVNYSPDGSCAASPTELYLLSRLPLRPMSRLWGRMSETELPPMLQCALISSYAAMFGVNLEECAQDWRGYRSLQAFFTRSLRDGCRPPDPSAPVVSPADGIVAQCIFPPPDGNVAAKGVPMSLSEFLCDPPEPLKTKRALFVVYLSPGDYHRFHSPAQWQVDGYKHVVGQLLTVRPQVLRWVTGLLALNERVILNGRWRHGRFHLAAVGATNVGSVALRCAPLLKGNVAADDPRPGRVNSVGFTPPLPTTLGEEMGTFRMGSTVVLLFDVPDDFRFCVVPGQRVRVGQAVGRTANTPSADPS